MPSPSPGESQKDFISRCMGDPEARQTFPNDKVRAGFCYTQWRRRKQHAKRKRLSRIGASKERRLYETQMFLRFRELKRVVRESIVDRDCFGLQQAPPSLLILPRAAAEEPKRKKPPKGKPTSQQEFSHLDKAEAAAAFMGWFFLQEDQVVLEVARRGPTGMAAVRTAWQDPYLDSAYRKAVAQATVALRKAKFDVGPAELEDLLRQPLHLEAEKLLRLRNFTELEGITEAVGKNIGRELVKGFQEGLSAADLADRLAHEIDVIGSVRARTLARTEVVSAWSEAALNTFGQFGVKRVVALVEFALNVHGLSIPCPVCAALAGQQYTVQEAHGVIPIHPNCQCGWVPVQGVANALRFWTRRTMEWLAGKTIRVPARRAA